MLCLNVIPDYLRDSCLELNVKLTPTQKFIYFLYLICIESDIKGEQAEYYNRVLSEFYYNRGQD